MNASKTSFRKSRETFLALHLRIVFPYCLNNSIGDEPKKEDKIILVAKSFSPSPRNHSCVTRENCHHTGNVITPERFLKINL